MTKLANSIRKVHNTTCSVVVVAGGNSTRMGENKLFMDLLGRPVLARTLQTLEFCSCVKEIVLVTREQDLEACADLCKKYNVEKCKRIVVGGKSRTESALNGLSEIDRSAKIVLIHDGARPLVTEEIVYDAMHTAALFHCAAPAIPVTDTVKEQSNGVVSKTLQRDSLAAIQTPQAFVPEIIKAALTNAVKNGLDYTDDCAAVEAIGIPVHLSKGSPENIKITNPMDIQTATAILKCREH